MKKLLWMMFGILFMSACHARASEHALRTEKPVYRDDLYYVMNNDIVDLENLRHHYTDVFQALDTQHSVFDDTGAIPDAKAAVDSALELLVETYGVRMVQYTPFQLYFYRGAWIVVGTLALPYALRQEYKLNNGPLSLVSGPVPIVILRQSDGKVLLHDLF
ncbi:NTF2 fold immunity protein [Entomospira entomophila]|uniref:NTF2 fold domain-containing protein n=1 Tax=Entomospira entomophila TaxID=2719988 RepID=A0A968KRL8_9SPIO|nr:NTF2 fold immunity protein [Entomospira entomophilus]NIZ40874.1 hypothetical protein [Entomospira entomophilus]WDI35087.1 NTF2 fold immunity protein [Entomospira entomophilus]